MSKKLKKEDVPQGCGRFVPFERSYKLWDIVDSEKLEYVDFIMPYTDIDECEKTCNVLNVVDYLLKEFKGSDSRREVEKENKALAEEN